MPKKYNLNPEKFRASMQNNNSIKVTNNKEVVPATKAIDELTKGQANALINSLIENRNR